MRYAFGDVEVDTTQIRLVKDGVLVECEPKVFTLLVYFCQHPEKAISRAELVEKVWGVELSAMPPLIAPLVNFVNF